MSFVWSITSKTCIAKHVVKSSFTWNYDRSDSYIAN